MTTQPPDDATPTGVPHRGRGRDIEEAALEAARELLAADGVKKLTIERLSARTGIAKTSLYRRWRSKEDLALAVVLDMARTAVAAPIGNDTRTALINYLSAAIAILGQTPMGRVMQGLASDLATDADMAAAFRTEVIALRQTHLIDLVDHGIEQGQLRPDIDVTLLQELLFGPIYYRLLFSGHPLDTNLAETIVDAVLPSITPPAT